MSSTYHRLLPLQIIVTGQVPTASESFDAGAYSALQVQIRILVASGGSGSVKLQHAAVNEPDAFDDIPSATWPLTSATKYFFTATNFLRYVRWVASGTVTGTPAALIDIVAKE